MDRFAPNPHDLAEAIRHAPGWARVGLTFGDDRLRARATLELARSIVEHLEDPAPLDAANQLALPL